MLYRTIVATAIVVVAVATASFADETTPQQGIRDNTPHTHAFIGATIIVSPGNVMPAATLVVRDGRIEGVGADVSVPPDAVVHDGE